MPADYTKQKKANTLRHFISLLHPFMGSVAYFFKSNIDGFRTIWQHWVKTPLSDVGTGFSVLVVSLSGFILYTAKNKNLAKNFNFFYATLQMVFALLSGLMASASLAIAISAMALNIVYSLGMFVYSFYKYKSYAKENTAQSLMLKKIYKKAMIKYAMLFAISLFVLSSFLVVSVFFPFVTAAASLSVGLVTSIMLLGLGIYSAYCFFHFPKPSIENQAVIAEKSKLTNSISKNDLSAVDNKRVIFSDNYKKATFEYYQVNEKITQLTGNSDQDRKTLILEAYKNILQLEQQIFKARARGDGGFWSQESKRLAKLDFYKKSLVFLLPASPSKAYLYLDSLKELVEPNVIIKLKFLYESKRYALIQEKLIEADKSTGYYSEGQFKKYLNSLKQSVYQSFFRNIGKVEAFINALESYIEKATKQEQEQEQEQEKVVACISNRPRSITL